MEAHARLLGAQPVHMPVAAVEGAQPSCACAQGTWRPAAPLPKEHDKGEDSVLRRKGGAWRAGASFVGNSDAEPRLKGGMSEEERTFQAVETV